MATYFAKVDGTITGPHDADSLRRMAAEGALSAQDYISQDGTSKWVIASKVRGLFASKAHESAPEPSAVEVSTSLSAKAASILPSMPSGFLTRRRRIAITGLANTGKTVFLTTLINHLNHHEPTIFRAFHDEKPVTVTQFTNVDTTDGISKFGRMRRDLR